jgi:hypothetical protein
MGQRHHNRDVHRLMWRPPLHRRKPIDTRSQAGTIQARHVRACPGPTGERTGSYHQGMTSPLHWLKPPSPFADPSPMRPRSELTRDETLRAAELGYTDRERRVLLAGLIGGRDRDAVWSKCSEAIESLSNRGLLRIGQEVLADGTVSSFPLCLSPAGVTEARWLEEVDRLTSGR